MSAAARARRTPTTGASGARAAAAGARERRRRATDALLPQLLTTGNLAAGFYSITLSFKGDIDRAALAIVFAAVFDALDGRVARLTRSTSRFGMRVRLDRRHRLVRRRARDPRLQRRRAPGARLDGLGARVPLHRLRGAPPRALQRHARALRRPLRRPRLAGRGRHGALGGLVRGLPARERPRRSRSRRRSRASASPWSGS